MEGNHPRLVYRAATVILQSMLDRRDFLRLAAAAALLARPRKAQAENEMLTRPIPKTGEALPVIGLGTYQTFDVAPGQRGPLVPVMRRYLELGGRVIDSSPMYGQSEAAVGDVLAQIADQTGKPPSTFIATKVWTSGKAEGEAQMAESTRRLGGRVDLMQIHNLVDWKTHLETLRAMKAKGTIRYIGVTHYATSAFGEIEAIMKGGAVDFIQIPYSIVLREAERRILPAAAQNRVAVLVMRPFEKGDLFDRFKGKPLPPQWVTDEIGCASWAQLFLKFILGHPAVTAPIPATASAKHLEDNMAAGRGPLPTEEQRRKIAALV
jgi:diketogulonate reductase-like aldo/keto reductase